ncbi:MAG: TolC family protein [Desulfobacteraceae bacterium]|nr:TolC family protein [Desulfobacteraceae bacterium]
MGGRLFQVIGCIIPSALWVLLASGAVLEGCARKDQPLVKEKGPLQTSLIMKEREKSPDRSDDARSGVLTIDRAIEDALRASPELEQIQQRIGAASEQVLQAEAAFYPRLVLSEDFNSTNNPVYALMNIVNQRRFNPNINFNDPGQQQNLASRIQGEWVLFEGGSRWYGRKAALGQHSSIKAELQAGRNRLVAKVSETYYRWLQGLGFIGVAERAFDAAKTDERLCEARIRAEMALPSEVLRLKVRTSEAHDHLVTARTGARRLQAGIERLLTRSIRPEEIPDPGTVISLRSPPEKTQEDAGALVKKALDNRPEMAAARFLVQSAGERVKSARGGLLPKIGATAWRQWDSEPMGKSAESWMLGLQATWPIFEGGASFSKIREARNRLKEIEAQGEQVALDIALEVNQAALAVQEAAEKLEVAQERKQWAEKALEEVRNLYRNQVVTVDSLLQAEVAWNQVEVSYTAALFDVKISQALLKQSLGDFAEGILTEAHNE